MIRTYFIDYFDLDFVLCVFIGTIMWYSILWILHGQISQIVSLFHFHLATLRNCEHIVSNFYTVVKLKLSILLCNFFKVTLLCKHLHDCYMHISILFLITFPLIHWVYRYSHHLLLHMSTPAYSWHPSFHACWHFAATRCELHLSIKGTLYAHEYSLGHSYMHTCFCLQIYQLMTCLPNIIFNTSNIS